MFRVYQPVLLATALSACTSVEHSICDQLGTHAELPMTGDFVASSTMDDSEPAEISITQTEGVGKYTFTNHRADEDTSMAYCTYGDKGLMETGLDGEFYYFYTKFAPETKTYSLDLINWDDITLDEAGIAYEDIPGFFGFGDTIKIRNERVEPSELLSIATVVPGFADLTAAEAE